MALAVTNERERRTAPVLDWRAERALLLGALRSAYPYLLALLAVVAILVAYQAPATVGVAVGGGYDAPYVQGFHDRDQRGDLRFRWATGASRVLLPGAGARATTLAIAAAARPDGVATPVRVVVNGIPLGSFTPGKGQQTYRFALPAADFSYGNLTVDLLSVPEQQRTTKGNTLDYGPQVTAVGLEGGAGLVKPALVPLLAWVVAVPLLYLLLLRVGLRARFAAAASAAAALAGAAGLAAVRLDFALYLPRLAALLLCAYAFLVLTDLLAPRLFARGGVALAPAEWRRLQLLVAVVLLLQLGGVLYPQLFIIDQPFHNQQFEKVLHGRFLELYRPDPGGISALPGQWDINAQIPYPPFLYLFGLPFYLWPLGRDLSINVWSVFLDVSRLLLLYYLARRLGASARASLCAAGVLGLTGATFLLHSWGNYPTTVSLYGAFLFLVLLVAAYDRLRRPAVFLGLLALLTATMLLYTVTAVFIGLFLLLFLAAVAWRGDATARRGLAPTAALLVLASALAFVAYYVQYIGPLLTVTLPAFRAQLAAGGSLGAAGASLPFTSYLAGYLAILFDYGVLISLLLAPFGVWVLLRGAHHRLAGPLLAAWFAVFVLFVVVGARVDMVNKQTWFILPALALGAGVACDALLARGPRAWLSRAAVGLYAAHLTIAGLALWVGRIFYTRH